MKQESMVDYHDALPIIAMNKPDFSLLVMLNDIRSILFSVFS